MSKGSELHVKFSKRDKRTRIEGILWEEGSGGRFQASDYSNVDMVALFLLAVVGSCSGLESSVLVTKPFVR